VKKKLGTKNFRMKEIARRDLLRKKVYDIEIMENLLWLGTEFGAYVFNKTDSTGGFEDDAEGPMNNEVTAIGVFEHEEVWFGMANGVEVFDMIKKEWRSGPDRRFLTSDIVNYIEVDQFAAWIATNNGVLKYDKQRDRWVEFTILDGLLSNIVNCILIDGDYAWFGTPEGLTRFYWNAPYRID